MFVCARVRAVCVCVCVCVFADAVLYVVYLYCIFGPFHFPLMDYPATGTVVEPQLRAYGKPLYLYSRCYFRVQTDLIQGRWHYCTV